MKLKALPLRIALLQPRVPELPAARTKRLEGRPWRRIRADILKRDPMCKTCDQLPSVEVDHVKPVHLGGGNDPSNLAGICKACHEAKSAAEQTRRFTAGLGG